MADDLNPEQFDDGSAIWSVAGFADTSGNYVDFEKFSENQLEAFGDDWAYNAETVTISWIDADTGEVEYAVLYGPFEDMQDLEDAVDVYFQEGSE